MGNDPELEKLLKARPELAELAKLIQDLQITPSNKGISPEVVLRIEAMRADMNALYAKPPSSPPPKIVLDAVLKKHLAPFLKHKGYKKKGWHFWLTEGEFTKLISVQRSQRNNAWESRFCINLGVDWKPLEEYRFSWRSRVAPASIDPCGCFFHRRLTKDSTHADKWWELRSETDPNAIGKDVVEALTQIALPWLELCCDPDRQMEAFGPGYELTRNELKKFLCSRKQQT